MPKKVILICESDINEEGIVTLDMSEWDGDIIIPPFKNVTFDQTISCNSVQTVAENVTFSGNLNCAFLSGKNVHVKGNFICGEGNAEVDNLVVGGDCSINGNLECNNVYIFGHVGIEGNLKCKGRVNFMARTYLNGDENYAFGVKLNKKLPMVCFDQCTSTDIKLSNDIIADRVFIMFDEKGDEMISLPKSKTFMKIDRFDFEFGYGYPGFHKYVDEVKSILKKESAI